MPDYKAYFAPATPLELEFYDRRHWLIGTLKIKPSTILWKPLGAKRYRSVSLEEFAKWIGETGELVKF